MTSFILLKSVELDLRHFDFPRKNDDKIYCQPSLPRLSRKNQGAILNNCILSCKNCTPTTKIDLLAALQIVIFPECAYARA